MSDILIPRRKFLQQSSLLLGSATIAGALPRAWAAPAFITSDHQRPQVVQGLQMGDVTANRGLIWSRTDRPARLLVEYSYHENFRNARTIRGPYALEDTDFTARVDLSQLIPDQEVFVRVTFQDVGNERILSEPIRGRFTTAPTRRRNLHFVWGGDTAGQGWGINPEFGGMRIYETMRREQPDFFLHCGDTIYADGPISEYQNAENGQVWRNLVTEEVAKVAETMAEFRGRYKYNLLDDNVRAFNAEVPQVWQWDDHEVTNNWSDAKDLSNDARYTEKNVPLLVARGAKAFLEYAPMRPYDAREQERVYRHLPYGDLMDLLVVDMRSYRGPNTPNDQPEPTPETRFFGEEQLQWLKQKLLDSRAVWKVIAADMPVGLIVRDGDKFENMANGDGQPLGRELEMAELLRFIKRHNIDNVVWLTADVHYCAAHYYHPENAVFKHFNAFWEFVAGPLNAGTFGPGALDNTFGPEVVFQKFPAAPNLSPLAGLQFYGDVKIDPHSAAMTVSLKDLDGNNLFSKTLEPEDKRPGKRSWHK